MEKTGDVMAYLTRCDFCSELASEIDDNGKARCPKHSLHADESLPAGKDYSVKCAAEMLQQRHDSK